ncbi:MAG: FAS1-like dehydratase domain-containing protein [Streptosporangiaceae bacterium]
MAVNKDYAGRSFPATQPYEVCRVKIAEFADAIGDSSPVYRDREAAVSAGYPDVIAPPTFPIVVTMAASGQVMADPGLGINYALVVHGEQRFRYGRPLHAGDVVTAQATIESIKTLGRNVVLTTRTEVQTVGGEQVCTAYSTVVERGTAQEAE